MFPTMEVPSPLAEFVIERANIAPGRTGMTDGFPEEVEVEVLRLVSEELSTEEPDGVLPE